MKIKKLQIKNYKNLDAELEHASDLIAFIGNNGSGKSNMLEAISQIFRSLYVGSYKVDFDYFIEYQTSKQSNIKIHKKGSQRNYLLNDKPIIDITNYLPQKVVGIYSGEEGRLYDDCFGPFYTEFVKNINKAEIQGTMYSDLPKMLYLNKFYWHLSLLSLLISDAPDNISFIKNVLNISQVDKIKIDFNRKNYVEYNDNLALNLVRDIDAKSEYELDEFKAILHDNGYTADNVYKYLYLAFTPKGSKIIVDIIIKFNQNLTITDLSEGEKKLLLIKAALEFAGQEDSIFLLDEPDAHIHVSNKEQITKSFMPYQHNRQIIITTHSPTLTQCVKDENVYMLNRGKIEDRNRQDIINELTGEFWNKHQQNSFLSSNKPVLLLVEGIHDKTHIENAFSVLGDEYQDLSFDIFFMDSACNIPPMLLGLRTCDVDFKKLFIGVFDDDNTGRVELNKTESKYPNDQNIKRHKLASYAVHYPYHSEFYKSKNNIDKFQFTVENMFDSVEYEQAYKEALDLLIGNFSGKSIDKINEELKDKSKSILVEKSKKFTEKENFKHFRNLFNLIREIKNHYEGLKSSETVVTNPPSTTSAAQPPVNSQPITSTNPQPKVSINPKPQIKAKAQPKIKAKIQPAIKAKPLPKISAKTNHLAYWKAFKSHVSKQKVSYKLQTPQAQHWTNISIGSSTFHISVLANTQKQLIGLQLICHGKRSLNDFLTLRKLYESDSKEHLNSSIEWVEKKGAKEHHINLFFDNNDPFDRDNWPKQHVLLGEWVEKFYTYFKDKVKSI